MTIIAIIASRSRKRSLFEDFFQKGGKIIIIFITRTRFNHRYQYVLGQVYLVEVLIFFYIVKADIFFLPLNSSR
jgi:hypothetical protein